MKIVYVDSFKIRNTFEDDYGILEKFSDRLAADTPKFWIPKDEVWIDYRFKDEADFLLEVDAFTEPDVTTTYEEKRALAKKKFHPGDPIPEYVHRSEVQNNITIKYVDGGIVRRYFDPEFIFGGHDLVYDYIPEREIWLDDKMDPEELPYILVHEARERELMEEGKSYAIAHDYATATDKDLRRTNGVGVYPGDPNYPWRGMTNEKIIKNFYVVG